MLDPSRRYVLNLEPQPATYRWLLRDAFLPALGFIVVVVAFVLFVAAWLVLDLLQWVYVAQKVVWRYLDIAKATLDVLFLIAKDLIGCDLTTEFQYFVVLTD